MTINKNQIDLNQYRKNIYHRVGVKECAHYGEDGVLEKIFEVVGVGARPLVIEFGESKSLGTTTRAVRIKHRADAIYFAGQISLKSKILNVLDILKQVVKDRDLRYLRMLQDLPYEFFVTPNNIQDFMSRVNGRDLAALTIDIDTFDYFVAQKILEEGFRPTVLILEYNWNLPNEKPLSYPFRNGKVSPPSNKRAFGANLLALSNLAKSFEYSLVHVSGFCNLFFMPDILSKPFISPDLSQEIPTSDDWCREYIQKYCPRDFRPSWFDEELLTERDLAFFEEV